MNREHEDSEDESSVNEPSNIDWFRKENELSGEISRLIEVERNADPSLEWLSLRDILQETKHVFYCEDEVVSRLTGQIVEILDKFIRKYGNDLANDIDLNNAEALKLEKTYYTEDVTHENIYNRICYTISKYYV